MSAVLLALAVACIPQRDPDDALRATLRAFAALPNLKQAMVVHRLEGRLADDPDPAVRRIVALRVDAEELPRLEPRAFFDPEVWAPVAAKRRLIPARAAAHRRVRKDIPPVRVLPDLHREVHYDWRTGQVVRGEPLSFEQRFENLLRGYPPGTDSAYARILAVLDRDREQRRISRYLGHLYADRDGGVYEGITLYEAWYCGKEIEIPDVDVIPFAAEILGDRSFVSPIPADVRRDRLYQDIKDAALENRRYRTLREAAAAAFVRAVPEMDPMYARLVPRFHYLYETLGDDVDKVRRVLDATGSREELIRIVDRAVTANPDAFDRREGRRKELEAMAARVRRLAREGLEGR